MHIQYIYISIYTRTNVLKVCYECGTEKHFLVLFKEINHRPLGLRATNYVFENRT